MPKITYLKEFEGGLWARLMLDNPTTETVHIFTDSEIRELKDKERKAMWAEISQVVNRWEDE